MGDTLHIIEISPHIYAGAVNKKASIDAPVEKGTSGYYTPSIPTGGIAYLFNKVFDYSGRGDIIFVGDRNPTIKKEIYPEYKKARNNKMTAKAISDKQNIESQKEMAEIILKDCGFQVYTEEGYEADDIIYSLCKKYGKDFKHIFIHAGDSDNYINVTDNISILPASSKDKIITRENYETEVDKKSITPYSSINFSHFLFGKASNDVPALPAHQRDFLVKLLWNEQHFPFMREKEMMRALIEHVCPAAVPQFDIIYPLDMEIVLENYEEKNQRRIDTWGGAVDCNRYRNRKQIPPAIQPTIDQFFAEGRAMDIDS